MHLISTKKNPIPHQTDQISQCPPLDNKTGLQQIRKQQLTVREMLSQNIGLDIGYLDQECSWFCSVSPEYRHSTHRNYQCRCTANYWQRYEKARTKRTRKFSFERMASVDVQTVPRSYKTRNPSQGSQVAQHLAFSFIPEFCNINI